MPPILVRSEDINEDRILKGHMLADEKNTLIRDIKSEFSKIMPKHSLPHFLTIDPHASLLSHAQSTLQHVYMGMLQIHCSTGYHYMALLHTELLLEFHIVSHATATPLNHLLSLFAEHIDISDGRYCQVCKWRTNLRRCSACSSCYHCSHTCQRSDCVHQIDWSPATGLGHCT